MPSCFRDRSSNVADRNVSHCDGQCMAWAGANERRGVLAQVAQIEAEHIYRLEQTFAACGGKNILPSQGRPVSKADGQRRGGIVLTRRSTKCRRRASKHREKCFIEPSHAAIAG